MCPPRLPLRDFLSAAAGQDKGKNRARTPPMEEEEPQLLRTLSGVTAGDSGFGSGLPPPSYPFGGQGG